MDQVLVLTCTARKIGVFTTVVPQPAWSICVIYLRYLFALSICVIYLRYQEPLIHTATQHTDDFLIFPALHLKGGKSFDFTENAEDESSIPELPEPVACARYWIEQNAKWIHVMNVDAALDDDTSHNWPLVERLC